MKSRFITASNKSAKGHDPKTVYYRPHRLICSQYFYDPHNVKYRWYNRQMQFKGQIMLQFFSVVALGWDRVSSFCNLILTYCGSRNSRCVWSTDGMVTPREIQNYLTKIFSQCQLVPHNSRLDYPRNQPSSLRRPTVLILTDSIGRNFYFLQLIISEPIRKISVLYTSRNIATLW